MLEQAANTVFNMPDLMPAMAEIFVLTMVCFILVIDLFVSDKKVTYLLSLGTLVGASLLTFVLGSDVPVLAFSGMYVSDSMADVLKLFIYLVAIIGFIYARQYLSERQLQGEFYLLGLFGVLGMMVLVSAHNLLIIYLGLELLSLSLYAMVALQRDSAVASEAAMKYFVLGALASGMLLYGMSMLYGASGSLDLADVSSFVTSGAATGDLVLLFGLAFIVVGLAFKLGAVPFHMWVPDVYQGASTPVTLYIGTAPKIAAFAMLMRLLADGLGGLHIQWQGMLIVLAVLSMSLGNILAIAQGNLKRMLAYSTIAHVGYLLLGILTGSSAGYAASMFYVIVYALMALGGFGMIILLSRAGFEAEQLDDFKGLNERSPWFAAMMAILMFSMAGVPPFLGFWAKFSVLEAVVRADMVWLAVIAVIFAIIGAYYYLRIIKLMYFDKPEDSHPLTSAQDMRLVISLNSLAILALGIFPGSLMSMCAAALARSGM